MLVISLALMYAVILCGAIAVYISLKPEVAKYSSLLVY